MSEVMETDAVFEISFVMAVASPAWQNVSRYRAAVFTTDASNGNLQSAFGGAHLRALKGRETTDKQPIVPTSRIA